MTPDEMLTEASRLTALQRSERGLVPHPSARDENRKPLYIPGPYVATAQREERAREIIRLRKAAARA